MSKLKEKEFIIKATGTEEEMTFFSNFINYMVKRELENKTYKTEIKEVLK